MFEFLTDIGVQPLVAEFIANPEWIHVGTSLALTLFIIGFAYILRIDLDPFIFGRSQPFNAIIERLVFYAVILVIFLLTYYHQPPEDATFPEGYDWHTQKFLYGCGALLVLVLGRAIMHFIVTEKDRWDAFDQLPFYMMVLFQFFVPLLGYFKFERNMLMPKEQLGFLMAVIFIGYFAVRYLLGRPTLIAKNRVAPYLWLFIGYMLLTVIIFPLRLAAVKNVIQWIAWAACFFIGLAYIPDQRRRNVILMTIIMAALVSTLWGFWKYFDMPLHLFSMTQGTYPDEHMLAGQAYFYKTPTAGRYFLLAGFFANPNYYGEYLAMTIFIALGLLLQTESLKLRTFLSVILAINCFEMVALYNRAGWLGIFVALGFVIFALLYARIYVLKRVSIIGLAGGAVGLVLVLMLTGVIFNARETDDTPLAYTPFERLQSMLDFSGDETFKNRQTMWKASKFMLTDPDSFPQRLIFGGGFGFFEVNYLVYQTQVLESYDFNKWFHNVIPTFRAHNDHIQMLVEAGLVGTFFYAMFFIMFFVVGLRFIREEADTGWKLYGLAIMAAVMCLLGVACFSFPLHKIQHGGLAFTIMGFLLATITERKMAWQKNANEDPDKTVTQPVLKKKRKKKKVTAAPVVETTAYPPEMYRLIRFRPRPEITIPIIVVVLMLTIWGVYTQVINFKSHYLVVTGIQQLRMVDVQQNAAYKPELAQSAADSFWQAYKLDPTNGRAAFFNGFALTKKDNYEDAVIGTEHLEEGQLLYPQSDTYYALGMGYETRRRTALHRANTIRATISGLENQLVTVETETDSEAIESRIEELNAEAVIYEADAVDSQYAAIDGYMTAAQYYPVKVEYYKELIRLLKEQQRYEEIVFWAERSIVVYDWLLAAPPILWQLYLWLGEAHRALGGYELRDGNIEEGLRHWEQAEEALFMVQDLAPGAYYSFYELGQIYERKGDMATRAGNPDEAGIEYERSRDMYVEVYNRKGRVPTGTAPFDFAYFLLGRIYEKLEEPDRALYYYRGLLFESLYSKEQEIYQQSRQRIFEITGEWEGEGPIPPAE